MVFLDPQTLIDIALIGLSGALICLAVHFIPVGGAPAAMAQATGIGTGTVDIAPVLEYFLSSLIHTPVKIPADKTTYHSNDH
jgi:tetrahydromethanopterin S-methyltransferase subunit D